MCDECGKRLGFRKGWFHCVGDVFDLCKRHYELLGDEDKKDATYKHVLQKDDLAGDLTMYAPELHRQALREEAIVRFKEVGLAYKVPILKSSLYSCLMYSGYQGTDNHRCDRYAGDPRLVAPDWQILKVVSIAAFCCQCTRALTFDDFCQ